MSFDSGEHRDYFALAVSGLTIGGLMLPVLDPIANIDDFGAAEAALIAGGIVAGAAIVAGIVGIVLAVTDPQRVREGSTTRWQLEPSP